MSAGEGTAGGEGSEGRPARDPAALFGELVESFRSLTDAGLASFGFPARAPGAEWQDALRGLAAWASLPTANLERIVSEIRERRTQVQVLREQLSVFDEQLATLEKTLRPLIEWSRLWGDMQQSFLGAAGRPDDRRDRPQ